MADSKDSQNNNGAGPVDGFVAASPGAAKKKRKRRVTDEKQMLSINSLMDIVTIILVYLLKSYSTSPIDVKDPAIELPISSSMETVEDAAVVMVTGPIIKTLTPAPNCQMIPGKTPQYLCANTPALAVDGKALFPLKQVAGADGKVSWRVPDDQKGGGGFVIARMKQELVKAKEVQELASEINDREFTGKVVILADRRTPYRVLMDILVTCGQSGFGEFKFVIVKQSG
jgi:biopolymer transport protein ExbD